MTLQLLVKNVLAQELGGEVVLVNLENETYYNLNQVSSRMWQLLTEQSDVEMVSGEKGIAGGDAAAITGSGALSSEEGV